MEVLSIMRNVPMSPQKMRELVRQIQGLNAVQAQAILAVVPRKSAGWCLRLSIQPSPTRKTTEA
jgi:ribosomal protein L22